MPISWDDAAAAAAATSHRNAADQTTQIANHFDTLPAELAKLGPIAAPLQQAVNELIATRKTTYMNLGHAHSAHATALGAHTATIKNTDIDNANHTRQSVENTVT